MPSLSLLYSVSGFALSNIASMCWFWMTCVCCLDNLVTSLYTYGIWKAICIPQICVLLGNFSMKQRTLFSRCCSFIRWECDKFPGRTSISNNSFVEGQLLKHSLLNKEYNPINILKASAATISMHSPHLIFLSKIIPRYFTVFTKGMSHPFSVRGDSDILIWWEK